jgi:hypothetical protein
MNYAPASSVSEFGDMSLASFAQPDRQQLRWLQNSHAKAAKLGVVKTSFGTLLRMANPRYNWQENNVPAHCPDCDAITSFNAKGHSNTSLGGDKGNAWVDQVGAESGP